MKLSPYRSHDKPTFYLSIIFVCAERIYYTARYLIVPVGLMYDAGHGNLSHGHADQHGHVI